MGEERALGYGLAWSGQSLHGHHEVASGGTDREDARHRRSRKYRRNRSASTSTATRQLGVPASRRVSPSAPIPRQTRSKGTRDGASATPPGRGAGSRVPP